jgi:predicted transcriptional regulator
MRTTLEIDDDILGAAKELALRQKKTAGKVISELARHGIQRQHEKPIQKIRNGFEVLPAAGRVVTPQLVQKILEESSEG